MVAGVGRGDGMSRVFLSVSGRDGRQAAGLKKWLEEQVPGLAGEIYFYLDPHTGTPVGERWREALRQASSRCEAVICLVSPRDESRFAVAGMDRERLLDYNPHRIAVELYRDAA